MRRRKQNDPHAIRIKCRERSKQPSATAHYSHMRVEGAEASHDRPSRNQHGRGASDMSASGSLYHPAFGETVRYEETVIPDDPDGQVVATVRLMRKSALADALAPEMQREAAELKSGCKSQRQIAERCWHWVKSRVRFVEDEELFSRVPEGEHPTVETLIRPRDMVRMGETAAGSRQGDCDDFSMYLACLLTAAGVPCSFVTVAADSRHPDNYSHVYVAAYPGGERLALDASHGDRPGWETQERYRVREFPVTQSAGVLGLLAAGLIGYLLLLEAKQ